MLPYRCATLAGVVLLASNACQTSPPKSRLHKIRMALAASASLTNMPVVLAKELGFYTGEGLEVSLDDTPGGSKAMQSLLAGSVDAVASQADQVITMAAEGRELKSFVLLMRVPGVALVALPQHRKPIHSIKDLKGGTIAVTSPGSPVHMFVNYLLVKNGMSLQDVSVVGSPSSAGRVSALEHGKVDAAILPEPGFTILKKRHPREVIVLADLTGTAGLQKSFGTDVYPGTIVFSTATWLRQNSETAHRLARAIQRSLRWCREHSAHEIAERMPADLRIEDRATYEEAIQHLIPILSQDGVMPADAVQAEKRIVAETSEAVRRANIDVVKTYTNEYVQP